MYLKRLSQYSCYAFTCFGFLLGFVAETHQRHQHLKVEIWANDLAFRSWNFFSSLGKLTCLKAFKPDERA